jgi:hypothetical protein
MKILIHGRLTKFVYEGNCPQCGCKFQADKGEVKAHDNRNDTTYSCTCPTVGCGETVYCDEKRIAAEEKPFKSRDDKAWNLSRPDKPEFN